jgi:hypothetical protein
MPYYVVNAGSGRSSTHIVKSGRSWTADSKTTLCGLPATRYVDVFAAAEASCRECRKRWQLAIDEGRATARRWAERQQRFREMPGLHRTSEDVAHAGGSVYAAVRYETASDPWRRRYLSSHPAVAQRLFPNGVPD